MRTANRPNTGTRNKTPRLVSIRSPTRITMVHSTSDSSVKAEKKSMCTITLGKNNKQGQRVCMSVINTDLRPVIGLHLLALI